MKILLVIAIFVFGTCTILPGTAKESAEKEYLSFTFIGRTHHLVIKTNHNSKLYKCYVVTLTDDEINNAHTDAGMVAIELKYIRMIVVAKPTTADQLASADRQVCSQRGVAPNATVEWFTL